MSMIVLSNVKHSWTHLKKKEEVKASCGQYCYFSMESHKASKPAKHLLCRDQLLPCGLPETEQPAFKTRTEMAPLEQRVTGIVQHEKQTSEAVVSFPAMDSSPSDEDLDVLNSNLMTLSAYK